MKKYTYNGTTNLVFSFEDNDYLVHGEGPHDLPESAPIVQTHLSRGSLVSVVETDKTKVKNA